MAPQTMVLTLLLLAVGAISSDYVHTHVSLVQRKASVLTGAPKTSPAKSKHRRQRHAFAFTAKKPPADKSEVPRQLMAKLDHGPLALASTHFNEKETDGHSHLVAADNDLQADFCGTRFFLPQLQFEMELYGSLGLITSHYAQCRIPPTSRVSGSLSKVQAMLTQETHGKDIAESSWESAIEMAPAMGSPKMQAKRAWVLTSFWAVGVAIILVTFLVGSGMGKKTTYLSGSFRGRSSWRLRVGFALSWLDPIIGQFKSTPASKVPSNVLNALSPDFEVEPHLAMLTAWRDEVTAKGLEHADLGAAIKKFVGTGAFFSLISIVVAQMVFEFLGLTVVLDVLLNYLRWLTESGAAYDEVDKVGPSIMIIFLGFGFPMLARYFSVLANMRDGYGTNRISAGLMALVHDKSQRLPEAGSRSRTHVDVSQLVACDATRVWGMALKSYAQLVCSPLCMLLLVRLLYAHFGKAAVAAGGTLLVCGAVAVPLRKMAQSYNMRWMSLSDARAMLTKETLSNVVGFRSSGAQEHITKRILEVRMSELKAKLEYFWMQMLLTIPVSLLPLALVTLTCSFHITLAGGIDIDAKDVFVCMQVLTGGSACCSVFASAVQRVLNLPNSVKRIESYLKEPEHKDRTRKPANRHGGAPVVQVRGSYSHEQGEAAVLHDLDLEFKRGEMVAVVGGPASGKSSLLSAVLGELPSASGDANVECPAHVSYCAQTPWMLEGHLRDNIALDEPLDGTRFEGALAAAGLSLPALSAKVAVTSSHLSCTSDVQANACDEARPWKSPFPYFFLWKLSAVVVVILGVLNVDWSRTPLWTGIFVVALQAVLHWSVVEIPLQTLATFFVGSPPPVRRAPAGHLTLCMNYNLLAVAREAVDACFENMYEAYMGSLDNCVSAVLVSATNDPMLQDYELQVRDSFRERIFSELVQEGLVWAGLADGTVDPQRLQRIWSKFDHMDRQDFAGSHLHNVCSKFAKEFMVVHRVSRVLRKCGQYQDLMLLSEGYDRAFTYCDEELYGSAARRHGEPLFHHSGDVDNIKGRRFDYTLVLDSDTRVVPGSVFHMLEIGAGNPDRAIVQPAIQMDCKRGDSIFSYVESMRQTIHAPLTDTVSAVMGESGFYGKGLIKNSVYIEKCLGTPEKLLEVVPINVLSHDTFEAMIVQPIYAKEVQLLEAPCCNYVTWDIRERRWNRGELILALYFFPTLVGAPVRFMQRLFQGGRYTSTGLRTKAAASPVSSYLAHAALRQIVLKPALVAYIVSMDFVAMRYQWTPLLVVLFSIIVLPKFACGCTGNVKAVVVESIASILQFTPESVVGTIRVLRALKALLTGNDRWVPQHAVEEDFENSNPFLFTFSYLWYYPVFAILTSALISALLPEAYFVMWMLGTLLTLPFYAGFTALKSRVRYEIFPYFSLWNLSALVAITLGAANVDWDRSNVSLGLLAVAVQGVLHWSVMEIPLQAMATLFCATPPGPKRQRAAHLTVCLNYNLLAVGTPDVDACMDNMYDAFMGNISENVSACLVSATNDPELKAYELEVRDRMRERIVAELRQEGRVWAGYAYGTVDDGRARRFWSKYNAIDRKTFMQVHLEDICQRFAEEFMVVHRVSRVLRKCGQYQDLMLLSAGHAHAFTYCDKALYGNLARPAGELLFEPSADVENIRGRGFDYTLVLDADTMVESNTVHSMMEVGAGNPERAIIQPAILMSSAPGDSIFGHVEAMRQVLTERMTNTLTALLGECGFYGKGLIKNSLYISKCIGTPEKLLEVVPIDVLSHDTFEASVVQPLYAGDLTLKEAPCGNYVTWDIRERRWNRGELVLAMYFFPRLFGVPIGWLQALVQGRNFEKLKVRHTVRVNRITSYIAHAALRQMVLKPVLVTYIILLDCVKLHYQMTPFIVAMFFIIVFPKIITCTEDRVKPTIIETAASVLQFTPECVVGTIRVLRAFKAHLTGNARWVPQRAVEEDFERSNPFVLSMAYLWYYPCFAAIAGLMVAGIIKDGMFIMWMLGTLFTLPFYAGFTSLRTPRQDDALEAPWAVLPSQAAAEANVTARDSGRAEMVLPEVFIGPGGSMLSSAERAQVAFARAAYRSRASVVLMDDPFASLDAATSEHMLGQLADCPLFTGKTRIVAMPSGSKPDMLRRFDRVVILEAGRVAAEGSPAELLRATNSRAGQLLAPGAQELVTEPAAVESFEAKSLARLLGQPKDNEETESRRSQPGDVIDVVGWGGPKRIASATGFMLVLRVVTSGQLVLFGMWADRKESHLSTRDDRFVRIMMFVVGVAGMLQLLQSYCALTFSNSMSQAVYERALSGLQRSPLGSFWDLQSSGRILNRLSGDMFAIDYSLAAGFPAIFSFVFSSLFQQIYCIAVLPAWLTLMMYLVLGSFVVACIRASTSMQYSSLFALSKCHELQLQSASSQASIRAYECEASLAGKFRTAAGAALKANLYGVVCTKQWLVFRLCLCICFQCTVCMLSALLRPEEARISTLTIVVLLSFNLIQQLEGFVDSLVGSIGFGMAIRRLSQYYERSGGVEQPALEDSSHMPKRLMDQGAELSIDGVGAVTAKIEQGSWMAIVGDAGKSELLLALAGLADASEGSASLGDLKLAGARRAEAERIGQVARYLPQQPLIFNGSLRFNVDPTGKASDEKIRSALACAMMHSSFDLDMAISASSGGLSHGQRQLVCLARAVCAEPALLLLDGALSAVDYDTQRAAYAAIAEAFPKSIAIVATPHAERVSGFDVICTLSTGSVVRQRRAF